MHVEIVDGPHVAWQTSRFSASTTRRWPLLFCLQTRKELGGEVEKGRVLPDGEDGRVDAAEKVDKPALFEIGDQKPAEIGTPPPPRAEKGLGNKLERIQGEYFVGMLLSRL